MSTGSLSLQLSNHFLDHGDFVCLVMNKGVSLERLNVYLEQPERLKVVPVETTEEMLDALESERNFTYDLVIHAAAVGDYKGDFSFLMEDLAEELFEEGKRRGGFSSAEEILNLLTSPTCKLDDSSKISSYQQNLTVKLTLTPKIIAWLREWFPQACLVGCKLLENVEKEELFQVAQALCKKNGMDFILGNDLADLRKGLSARYLVNEQGFTGVALDGAEAIFAYFSKH